MSTEQLRIGVTNSVRQKKKRDEPALLRTTRLSQCWNQKEVQLLVSPPTRATVNRMQGRVLSFDRLAGKIQLTQLCEKLISYIFLQPANSTKFDQMGTTDGEKLLFCAENTRFLDIIRMPKLWQLFLKAQSLNRFWKFILWKFWTDME